MGARTQEEVLEETAQLFAAGIGIRVKDMYLKRATERIADYYDTSVSWVVRRALEDYVKNFEKEKNIEVYEGTKIRRD